MLLIPASSLQLIWTPTDLNFLSPGLYNNLASTLLPASVAISHSIQLLDSQGYILIFLDRMHLLFTQLHFLFWQLGRVGGQYTTILMKIKKPKLATESHCFISEKKGIIPITLPNISQGKTDVAQDLESRMIYLSNTLSDNFGKM